MWITVPVYKQDYIAHHGVKGQSWGVRYGPPYPLSSDALSRKIYDNAKRHEPKITNDIQKILKGTNAKLDGLDHKLKTKDSLKRKIETDSKEKGISIQKAGTKINDAVRYSTVSQDNFFVTNYIYLKNKLSDLGYKEIRCKNYYDEYRKGNVKHKSVQSVFQTKDGYNFEIQFHTPSSLDARKKKVPIYEERRKVGISDEDAIRLEKEMVKLAENVSTPKDIYKIKSH